jgi:tetratricopeptide (TPR) repeat protein
MADKSSLQKEAQKWLAKGQIDKALGVWEQIASSYPDGNTLNYVGDLYLKKGDKKAAVEKYHQASKIYLDEGFALKGLALYKKILNLNPRDAGALIALGGLNEDKNITTDAIKYYLAAADILSKERKRDSLLEVYNKVLKLAPTNIKLKAKIAELFTKEGFVNPAGTEYFELGRLHQEKGLTDKAISFFTKSIELVPNNKNALLSMSTLSENDGNIDQAIEHTQTAIERIGDDADLLLRIANLLMKKGAMDKASDYLSTALKKDPDNIKLRKLQAEIFLKAGDLEKAWEQYGPVFDALTADDEFDEAAAILNEFKDHDPVESRKKLISVYKQAGDAERAFEEMIVLSDIYNLQDMQTERIGCLKEALDIQPDNAEVRQKIEEIEGAGPVEAPVPEAQPEEESVPEAQPEEESVSEAPPEEVPAAATAFGTPEVEHPVEAPPEETPIPQPPEAADHEKTLDEELIEVDIFLKYGLFSDAKKLLDELKMKAPESLDVHMKLKSLAVETNDTDQAVTECIILANLYERAGDEENKISNLKEAYQMAPNDPRLEGRLEAIKPVSDIEEAPETEEAPAAEEAPATEEAPAAEEAAVPDFSLDDFETLDVQELQEPDFDNDVLEIFDEFKKGLEQEIEAEDTETHYNLGIAYKEMGLIDDAVKIFQTTSKDPNYYVKSAAMLGICYMEKGMESLAIEAFTGALMKIDSNDETAWSLRYELGDAYEKTGNIEEAFRLYTDVFGWNAKFRDVSEKVETLKKTSGLTLPSKEAKTKKSRVSYI